MSGVVRNGIRSLESHTPLDGGFSIGLLPDPLSILWRCGIRLHVRTLLFVYELERLHYSVPDWDKKRPHACSRLDVQGRVGAVGDLCCDGGKGKGFESESA